MFCNHFFPDIFVASIISKFFKNRFSDIQITNKTLVDFFNENPALTEISININACLKLQSSSKLASIKAYLNISDSLLLTDVDYINYFNKFPEYFVPHSRIATLYKYKINLEELQNIVNQNLTPKQIRRRLCSKLLIHKYSEKQLEAFDI